MTSLDLSYDEMNFGICRACESRVFKKTISARNCYKISFLSCFLTMKKHQSGKKSGGIFIFIFIYFYMFIAQFRIHRSSIESNVDMNNDLSQNVLRFCFSLTIFIFWFSGLCVSPVVISNLFQTHLLDIILLTNPKHHP